MFDSGGAYKIHALERQQSEFKYAAENNVLKVSWNPAENAKKYEITLYYDEK
ncbi:43918_t:CDS:2, partial [Gigaspora margarita]